MTRQQMLTGVGIILIIAAVAWRFALGTQLDQRFEDGWSWQMNTLGLNSLADEDTGAFPEGTTLADDPDTLNTRTISATANDVPEGQVNITDYYEVHNASTNALDWDFTINATVDAATGQYLEGSYEGDYYLIPRNAEQTTYVVSNSTYQSLPMAFQREEEIAGLKTYLYAFYGDLPNTQSYSDMELEEGQEVVCFDFEMEYWVEPTTGEIVRYRDWCEGDYVVDADGETLYGLQRWGSTSQQDDIVQRVDAVKTLLNNYRLNSLYIPMVLFVLGVLALGLAFSPGLLKDDTNNTKGKPIA
ncbi:MAG: porin PorA family protein [Anaerolineae bacterium]|nr:porin PorA family protein [Anaerolineae bacterium]MDQ7037044.1 porin PorA family protein [Anaerolineae bacterium]